MFADEPWGKAAFSGDPASLLRAAREVPVEEGVPSLMLLSEARYVFDAEGRCETTYRMVYRVVSQEGSQLMATTSQIWAPWFQERPSIRTRVITADGKVHVLDEKTLTESPVAGGRPDVFSDRRILHAPLPAIAPGAVAEEELVVRDKAPLFERGVTRHHYFGFQGPLVRERLILDAPESLPVRYAVRLLPGMEPHRAQSGGRVTITFDAGPLKPLEPIEPLAPSELPVQPYVAFTTGKSWREVAEGYHAIVERQIADADLGGLLDSKMPKEGRDGIISRVLARLHEQVRYTSVALGDASIVPRTPADLVKGCSQLRSSPRASAA